MLQTSTWPPSPPKEGERKGPNRVAAGGRLVPAALLIALLGCAGEPPPNAQLAVARAAVGEASRSGAVEHAPEDLSTARDKLARAEEAIKAGDNADARRLADEASMDAQLATAKARTAVATVAGSEARPGSTSSPPATGRQQTP